MGTLRLGGVGWLAWLALAWAPAVALGCGPREPDASIVFGDFRTTHVDVDFLLAETQPDEARVAALLAELVPARRDPELANGQLAAKLVTVSRCFGIDGAVFVSLVRQESAFSRTAVSPTGARGLTQFTVAGVLAVDDQLGRRGPLYARATATAFFRRRIAACVERPPAPVWVVLWERAPQGAKAERDRLGESADDALLYGAVLLKTLLSVARTVRPAATMDQTYAAALERYNGDPDPAVRTEYQRRILRLAAELR